MTESSTGSYASAHTGDVRHGRSVVAAAVREIAEETGLAIDESDLVGPLATRAVVHGYSDVVTTQDELFWFVRCAAFEVSTAGHTEVELATMTAHRWWTRAELEATDEDVWPRDLLRIWAHVPADVAPPAAPLVKDGKLRALACSGSVRSMRARSPQARCPANSHCGAHLRD